MRSRTASGSRWDSFWTIAHVNTFLDWSHVFVRTRVSSASFFDVRLQFFISLLGNSFLTSNICLLVDWNFYSQLYRRVLRVRFMATGISRKLCINTTFSLTGYWIESLSTLPSSKIIAMSLHDFPWLIKWFLTELPNTPSSIQVYAASLTSVTSRTWVAFKKSSLRSRGYGLTSSTTQVKPVYLVVRTRHLYLGSSEIDVTISRDMNNFKNYSQILLDVLEFYQVRWILKIFWCGPSCVPLPVIAKKCPKLSLEITSSDKIWSILLCWRDSCVVLFRRKS